MRDARLRTHARTHIDKYVSKEKKIFIYMYRYIYKCERIYTKVLRCTRVTSYETEKTIKNQKKGTQNQAKSSNPLWNDDRTGVVD